MLKRFYKAKAIFTSPDCSGNPFFVCGFVRGEKKDCSVKQDQAVCKKDKPLSFKKNIFVGVVGNVFSLGINKI
nr:hypothetical protein [Bacteroidota bacterium]